jgi:hypothetical protein
MILGYKFLCKGLKEPMSVKGDCFDECILKFREYWINDYDVDTSQIVSVNSIDIDFDVI